MDFGRELSNGCDIICRVRASSAALFLAQFVMVAQRFHRSTSLSVNLPNTNPLGKRISAIGTPWSAASVSALRQTGTWQTQGSTRTWIYSVQVPTAVSLSFHASNVVLPASAFINIAGPQATLQYRTRDLARGVLWSRPLVGDKLSISLSVDASETSSVRFEVDGVQAGYRGLGGLPSHPYDVQRAATAGTTQSCTLNYSCETTPANQGPAYAAVAILIGNLYQCTETLVNDTSADFAACILTARHCENGMLACGGAAGGEHGEYLLGCRLRLRRCAGLLHLRRRSALPSYATTIVEQQDVSLIRLAGPPVASDAYWRGWDASGAVFTGGYSIHHALGYDKQYVRWYGQAILQNIPAATLRESSTR